MTSSWLNEASEVRQTLDDSRVRLLAEPAEETRRASRAASRSRHPDDGVAGLAAPIAALSKGGAAALAAQLGARQ